MSNHTKHQDKYKHVTLSEIYLHYPHLWRDLTSKTIPRKPYVPVNKVSNHPYKLGFNEWKNVIDVYMDEVFNYLLQGFLFKMPFNMGNLRLIKYKYTYGNKNPNLFKWCRKYTDGYFVKLAWLTMGKVLVSMRNKSFFEMRITTNKYKKLKKQLEQDRSIIYRLSDAKIT